MPEKYPVKILEPSGNTVDSELEAWEESPSDNDSVMLQLKVSDGDFSSTAEDYFSALVEIRRQLEKHGRMLVAYGASLNVYPSPMSRSMGTGEKAYKLTLGLQAKTSDLVSIFESGPDVNPSTVEEQEEFFRKWLQSLKKEG
ncbi:MAG: hypothetical protein JWP91_3026 [Fibrobacteres bacterium]|nr:hypothetical protein [Fibrobacterota bacterium]